MELNAFDGSSFLTNTNQEILPTNLMPEDLLAHEHAKYVSYLSLRQLFKMLENLENEHHGHVFQIIMGRFTGFFLDILLVGLVLPCFLIRGSTPNIVLQIIFAFLFGFSVLLVGLVGRLIPPDWFSPVFSSLLPVLLLMPWAVNRLLFIRT